MRDLILVRIQNPVTEQACGAELGNTVRKGYGGSATATRRFGRTVQIANLLHTALSGPIAGNPFTDHSADTILSLMAGRSADDVMDAVVEAIQPVDGTQDAEACRAAIKDSLADVLTRFPNADFTQHGDQHRELAIERYVAADVFRRIDLDLGKAIREKAPNATIGLSRLKEVREYVRETVAAAFRKLRELGQQIATGRITQIVQSALRETLNVFEGYAE